ncbi:MAG: transglutaminase domain-containing protein [Bryobacteraceae bacterium]
MNRRRFLQRTSILSGGLALALPEITKEQDLASRGWQTFEVTTHIEILKPAGVTRVWAPVSLLQETSFQRTITNTLHCEAGTASIVKSARGLNLIAAEFPPGAKPTLTLTTQVETRNWVVDFSVPGNPRRATQAELNEWLKPARMLPIDGIVKQRATEITQAAKTEVDKARAIYEWIVENTYRNPKTRGCGTGDIRFMLESGDLGGKCADLNALFVGLARAAGLPARDVYGIRIAPSRMGCSSLGVSSENVTKAQHCRAEVYLTAYGWVPVDPADVRKVILEEPPGHLSLEDGAVKQVRARLFGSWEMNWMAYNYAQDIALPGAGGPPVHFLMYPQAETADGRLDSLDPGNFRYQITSREHVAARANGRSNEGEA